MASFQLGLIGSSLARVVRRENLAAHIAIATRSEKTLARAQELGFPSEEYAARRAKFVVYILDVLGAMGARTEPIAVPVQPGVAFRGVRFWPDAAREDSGSASTNGASCPNRCSGRPGISFWPGLAER